MNASAIVAGCKAHSIYTWSAGNDAHPLTIASAKGSWLTTADGERLLDLNSQSMNANLGHSHPYMVQALKDQLDRLPYAGPMFATEIRATISARLAAVLPEGLDKLLYTLGGAEANENAFRAARLFTGRHKILSFYRSYHGSTAAGIAATGDPRRWYNEPSAPGFIHVLSPSPYTYSFGAGDARGAANLIYLEETIRGEGAETIAAMIIEPVIGTNGVLVPPPGYLAALKALLEKYGILMICDEVMTGFGRSGPFWACDADGVTPDLLTMAKGLTCGYVPGGALALHHRISDYFDKNVFWGGLTCNSHPLILAAAGAVLDIYESEQILANVAARGSEMKTCLEALVARHPSVQAVRTAGMMGMIDVQDKNGDLLANLGGNPEPLVAFKKDLFAAGVVTFMRWSHITCMPPLNINAEDLAFGLAALDGALTNLDQRLGF